MVAPEHQPPATPLAQRRGSLLRIAILLAVLVVGAVMEADAERATLFGREGPHCPLRSALGDEVCPGCGLTRASVLAIHGDLQGSLAVHPAGILLVLACLGGIVIHCDILRRRRKLPIHDTILRVGGRSLAFGLVVAGLVRFLF